MILLQWDIFNLVNTFQQWCHKLDYITWSSHLILILSTTTSHLPFNSVALINLPSIRHSYLLDLRIWFCLNCLVFACCLLLLCLFSVSNRFICKFFFLIYFYTSYKIYGLPQFWTYLFSISISLDKVKRLSQIHIWVNIWIKKIKTIKIQIYISRTKTRTNL